ncbi:MAG: transcriptional regulator [Sulfurimonas sp. RIFCSPHIGHO2_12_FULL_36_9]|jgi:CRP/FNR family transcriptional regulator|uniref:Crp/Fnr family transcriptional regulator n=1 Tax=unclassified Sulfurimonas TaxID=2623549 RepID=UPI0008D775CA|nr:MULTISPECIES: Crp/Fnr family transcriptional regulator [unclassified Sulfurimonas]OHD97293.1 MAG: transcriptional regulator [Sulfurimonas sp. RIFCSPLOWO2_02_FULL_36_28]OHD99288.1 MAG: transcriptional regulator [Sulfurimonas sp. RIFCSPHIGHO2_12_FULL_36_9]OHE01234.1 MAG: transcriptional regulator [Sulfurimonas sp. RIFCSPLOWO2_12_FULL_36_74]OHE01501.1 MAG: transcriptional regulator [Sulfurimonas sp. RIFCSPLOWO2_12_36_12]
MHIKNFISSLDFFSSLQDDELKLLASFSSVKNYTKDYVLTYEKEKNPSLLFLMKGLVKAYKIDKYNNEIFLHYIYAPSLISDISTLKDDFLTSFANISILEDSEILVIEYKKFKDNFLKKGLLCNTFTNEIILKSQQLQSLINREFVFSSVAKVAMMLHDNLEIFNKLKKSEISLMLNIQPETLSRVLSRLKRDNIIDSKNAKIVILDSEALLSVYEE